MNINTIRQKLLGVLLGFFVALPTVFADDIEIYNNPEDNPLRPPQTILVLDLNLLATCEGTLTGNSNPANVNEPQLCLSVQTNTLLKDLLAGLTGDAATTSTFLSSLLKGTAPAGGTGLSATELCTVTNALGLPSPSISLGLAGTLSCSTLSSLLANPLTAPLVNGVLGSFVDQLVAGLVGPLLITAAGQLPTLVSGLLQATITGILSLNQVSLISVLESMLNVLINSRVAIMLTHADRSSAEGLPASTCPFGEQASIPTTRRETVSCSNGAFFLVGFTPLVDQGSVDALIALVTTQLTNLVDPSNIANSLGTLFSGLVTQPTDLLPPYQGKETYVEIANYLSGGNVYNAPLNDWDGLSGVLSRDTSIESGGNYIQPDSQCDTVNVLNVIASNTELEDESDAEVGRYFPGAASSGSYALGDVVNNAADPGITDSDGNQISIESRFIIQENLSSLAALSATGANLNTYANNLGLLGLGQTIAELLKPVLQINASLLTPSNTADATNPGQLRRDTFFPGFLPAEGQSPRWDGNLKKLNLKDISTDSNTIQFQYQDANGSNAIAEDGRIATNALTVWTDPSLLGSGTTADGRIATLGGAGQKIPGFRVDGGGNPGRANADGFRQLFYDKYTSGVPSLSALDADNDAVRNELQSVLGAANDAEAHELLLYARGYEVGTSANSLGTGSERSGRSWLHGAVLHSRPVAINYGARGGYTENNPDIRVLYGATDGYLRMLRNTLPSTGSTQSGVERWAFMPQAVMSQQKVLRDHNSTAAFPYGVDGAPTVVIRDRSTSGGSADGVLSSNNSHDRVTAYFGLRRGGSSMYALNLNNPDSPALLWRIGPDGLYNSTGLVAGSTTQFAEMALTMSSPQAGRVRYDHDNNASTSAITTSAVTFGAGYNGGRTTANIRLAKDLARGSDGLLGLDDSKGNAIYIVDGLSGELIWKATQGALDETQAYDESSRTFHHPLMVDSFAADVTAVDTNGDGRIDRIYALDTGGRLWRVDMPGSDRNDWTITPLASVGRHGEANVSNDRRFFQAPDYVPFRDDNGPYDAIVFGSGDRADPFNISTQNYLYAYRDRAVSSGKAIAQIATTEAELSAQSDFVDLTAACADAATDCGLSAKDAIGWKIALPGRGEKVLSQALSTGGVIYVSTYVTPDPNARTCVPQEGTNRLYGVALSDSRPVVPDFIADEDGDKRSGDGGTPGLPGLLNTLGTNTIAANTQTLEARSPRYYPVYWRERRGDDETRPSPDQ